MADFETRWFPLFYLTCRLRFRFYGQDAIRRYQQRKMKALARYARKHSPFFRDYHAGHDPDDPGTLPTVNKRIMMENLTGYNTVGLTREEILRFCLEVEKSRDFSRRLRGINVGMSSGTSGNKGVEIVTPREERYMKAALFARFPFPKGEKINLAFMLRVSAPAFSLGIFGHRLTYISQLTPLPEMRRQLGELNPNIISGPPSLLKILASEKESGTLDIRPKQVVSYAEILYPDVKEYIGRIFGCPVLEIYKCTEGPIAISCRHGSLHINEDLVKVETLNEDGSPTPPGVPCRKLIVTDLHKRSQPIIRYELNDLITVSPDRCACGSAFRVIERIQGRADDLFWARNRSTGEWQYIFPDYISRAIITASEEIDEYQAVQEDPRTVAVTLLLRKDTDPELFDRSLIVSHIRDVFNTFGCEEPAVGIEFGRPAPNPNSDKLMRIRRNFKPEAYEQ